MNPVDLRFVHPPGAALVLGGEPVEQPLADAELVATLPALRFAALAIPNASATLTTMFPALQFAASADYQSRAVRPVGGSLTTRWQPASSVLLGAQERMGATLRHTLATRNPWQAAQAQPVGVESRRAVLLVRLPVWTPVPFDSALSTSSSPVCVPHDEAIRLRIARTSRFEVAQPFDPMERRIAHQEGLRDRRRAIASHWQEAASQAGRALREAIKPAVALHRWRNTRWQNAMRPPPGLHPAVPGPVDETPPLDPCYTPNPHLQFVARAAANGHLVFLCENHPAPDDGGTVVVPIRRVYVVLNDVRLHRWPDGVPVPVFAFSLALDAASWTWGFEASLPAIAESLVAPTDGAPPVELVAHVNGTDFRVLAENLSRERSFGEASLRLSGRGRNAVLSAPYAPVLSFTNAQPRTARQLMDDVLTVNGVPLGWDIDWNLTDWNVPAGVFAQQGTWIEAIAAIAGAAGGYLLPHPNAATLRVRHRYPVAPWDWHVVMPDLVLPVDAVSRESLRWIEKPAYNRVFVSGQGAGVLGQVTRAGTAGNLIAPMIVDPLITEAAAARQRGIAVLADTGQQFEVGLRLPVLPGTGIVEPGVFIEYQDGTVARRGLVRATRIDAGLPEVWQTLTVECHA